MLRDRKRIGKAETMDRFVVNSLVALGTGLSVILIVGLVEFQPVGASTEGYDVSLSYGLNKPANT